MPMQLETSTVLRYLGADHQRLDGIMEGCKAAVKVGEMARAAMLFETFRAGLMRHIKIEEGLLFPEFEKATGMPAGGPTSVMRQEHEEILGLLGEMKMLFAGAAVKIGTFDQLRTDLVVKLHEHNMKEERVIYPMTDDMLTPDKHANLMNRMRIF